jgi:hypothetical protein
VNFQVPVYSVKLPITSSFANDHYVSTPAIPEGLLSGIQYFERNLKFRCPNAVVRHEQESRHSRYS